MGTRGFVCTIGAAHRRIANAFATAHGHDRTSSRFRFILWSGQSLRAPGDNGDTEANSDGVLDDDTKLGLPFFAKSRTPFVAIPLFVTTFRRSINRFL